MEKLPKRQRRWTEEEREILALGKSAEEIYYCLNETRTKNAIHCMRSYFRSTPDKRQKIAQRATNAKNEKAKYFDIFDDEEKKKREEKKSIQNAQRYKDLPQRERLENLSKARIAAKLKKTGTKGEQRLKIKTLVRQNRRSQPDKPVPGVQTNEVVVLLCVKLVVPMLLAQLFPRKKNNLSIKDGTYLSKDLLEFYANPKKINSPLGDSYPDKGPCKSTRSYENFW